MITATGLTKRYGHEVAVDRATFNVQPGRVTGFLGPNGAGKSTTMRLIIGAERPTSGSVTVNGRAYRDLRYPLREVGSLLDAGAVDPGRSAANHLAWLARSNDIDRRRVGPVLDLVGLGDAAGKRVGHYSLGMRQRLGLATALLGDPSTLLLDEPINGLDPDGILWLRRLLRSLADEGRTVFLSSHLMSEMAQTADHLVVIGRGRILADDAADRILGQHGHTTVRVRAADDQAGLDRLIAAAGGARQLDRDGFTYQGLTAATIGRLAAANGIALCELTTETATLEAAFFELTHADPPDDPRPTRPLTRSLSA